ncbi:hypothetical protein [Asticcacaulis tiandongensis]|uniref:hypothetical protein n=1 Tax=Asticcacaulis tiandongensis TaxID=2565365 RepID=UPI001128203B|nr:hypothetical protein [Asticcacaulis tiandongensis]
MYHLLVSGNPEAWQGAPFQIEIGRCVREYTADAITEKYAGLTAAQLDAFRRFPAIFAFENGWNKHPKFGLIRDVVSRQGEVRIEYDLIPAEPFLTYEQLDALRFELDIGKWELNRTHWAIKDIDLAKELHRQGIVLPDWARGPRNTVDVSTHFFDVALSFPGEARAYVEAVSANLERLLGPHTYFYDWPVPGLTDTKFSSSSLSELLFKVYRAEIAQG